MHTDRAVPGNRVVFWDFDGTLALRPHLWAGALRDALLLIEPASPVTTDQFRAGLSRGFPWHTPEVIVEARSPDQWWSALRPTLVSAYEAAGIPKPIAEGAASRVRTEFYRAEAWELIDGATDALGLTKGAGYQNVILSNHGPELPELVDALGLARWVTLTITSAAVGAEKPHPRIFEFARSASDAGPDTWMVGDNPVADIAGARRAGLRAILADGAYPDSAGVTVLAAARQIVANGKAPAG